MQQKRDLMKDGWEGIMQNAAERQNDRKYRRLLRGRKHRGRSLRTLPAGSRAGGRGVSAAQGRVKVLFSWLQVEQYVQWAGGRGIRHHFAKLGSIGVRGPHPATAKRAALSTVPFGALAQTQVFTCSLGMLEGQKLFLLWSWKVYPWLLSRDGRHFRSHMYKYSAVLPKP